MLVGVVAAAAWCRGCRCLGSWLPLLHVAVATASCRGCCCFMSWLLLLRVVVVAAVTILSDTAAFVLGAAAWCCRGWHWRHCSLVWLLQFLSLSSALSPSPDPSPPVDCFIFIVFNLCIVVVFRHRCHCCLCHCPCHVVVVVMLRCAVAASLLSQLMFFLFSTEGLAGTHCYCTWYGPERSAGCFFAIEV